MKRKRIDIAGRLAYYFVKWILPIGLIILVIYFAVVEFIKGLILSGILTFVIGLIFAAIIYFWVSGTLHDKGLVHNPSRLSKRERTITGTSEPYLPCRYSEHWLMRHDCTPIRFYYPELKCLHPIRTYNRCSSIKDCPGYKPCCETCDIKDGCSDKKHYLENIFGTVID
jgi:hypothetical protein